MLAEASTEIVWVDAPGFDGGYLKIGVGHVDGSHPKIYSAIRRLGMEPPYEIRTAEFKIYRVPMVFHGNGVSESELGEHITEFEISDDKVKISPVICEIFHWFEHKFVIRDGYVLVPKDNNKYTAFKYIGGGTYVPLLDDLIIKSD